MCQRLNVSRQGYYRFIKQQPTPRQQKYKELRTLIIDTFFKYNQKMGAQKLYDHLTNQDVVLSLSFVKSVLKTRGLVSKTVKTYKKKNTPHNSVDNKLNKQFEVSEEIQEQPRIVCDITEWKLHNGTKIYLCVALELATRAVVVYKVALNCEASIVTDVIHQVKRHFPAKSILFHSDQGSQFTSKEVVEKIASFQ